MNLALLREAVGLTYPEEFADVLEYSTNSSAVCCQFNRFGTLLAAGYNDGCVVIWDFLTRGVIKVLVRDAPITMICSVNWSRDGRTVLTASTDNNVCIWDILTGHCQHVFKFPCPVLKAQYHPRQSNQFLVTLYKHMPVLMSTDASVTVLPLETGSDLNIVTSYNRRGDHIYIANGKGRVWVIQTNNQAIIASFRATQSTGNSAMIKSLDFPHRGDFFITNTADRILRLFSTVEVLTCGKNGEPEPEGKLQDMVNKSLWKKCCFSGDGKYICAGSTRQHALFIFDRLTGGIVKILHGTKGEILLDVTWHPVLPVIASVANGIISLCTPKQKENWSAFAPDFKEIEDNIEYDEVEGEFDIYDEDKSGGVGDGGDDDNLELDVDGVEVVDEFVSSDEDCEDVTALRSLPISPDIDDHTATAKLAAAVASAPSDQAGITATDCHTPLTVNTTASGPGLTATGPASVSPAAVKLLTPPPVTVTPIILSNVMSCDEVHPLLGGRRSDKSSHSKRGGAGGGGGLASGSISPAGGMAASLSGPAMITGIEPAASATGTAINIPTVVSSRRTSSSKKETSATYGKPPTKKPKRTTKEPKWK